LPEIAVITGASAGVGRATAREFARRGCGIALLARGHDGLEATAREVEALGGEALVIPTDVADGAAVDRAADLAASHFGRIDIWVNNAFAGLFSRFVDASPEEYRRVTDVTYFGQVHGTRAALRHMLPRDAGAIVLVGSALAFRGIPLQSAYCGAKHALQGFQDSLRAELIDARSKVRLAMVQLPGVNTPQFDWVRAHVAGRPRPVGAVYEPEVAARAIWKAAHSPRKQWIVGAPAYQAIWGDKFLSPLLDFYLGRTSVAAQQGPEPATRNRPDNLFEPVAGDHGAHGRFGENARTRSPLLWASEHRHWLAAGTAIALGASMAVRRRKS
jgi:NAD(P)-dependent dehydrogenase (short-subunit alcohol dehydrogenase family)